MKLTDITNIGEARKNALEESGIFSAEDLINYFPYKYYDFSKTEPFSSDGRIRLIKATVLENAKMFKAKTGLTMIMCKMSDEIGHKFSAVWFNQTYVKSSLFLGEEVYLYGKNSSTKKDTFNVMMFKNVEKLKLGLLPVYHTVKGIGQKILSDAISFLLDQDLLQSIIPNSLEKRYNLITLNNAYKSIHFPNNEEEIDRAFERINIEKMLPLFAYFEFNKQFFKAVKPQKYERTIALKDEFESLLPFKLTNEQNNAIYDIESDLVSKFSMNRLLQGDVGSGKTAVSLYGVFVAVKNGYQAIVSAPTEILAKQHFDFILKVFPMLKNKIAFLSSSLTRLERSQILSKIESGKASIIVGTHSVFADDVIYKNVSYIVIDEQHRFGVEQRKKLSSKGLLPDILVMSATPIPRSLALAVYGDLELSVIHFRPKPLSVTTNIVNPSKQDDMWNYINAKINNGSKVYVVCAKIDEENEDDIVASFSAKSVYDRLKNKFGKEIVALVHGKLKRESQNKIINDFKIGKVKILVSTTIVEVGVDIPDADIMVIASPERFGLATLHQLRGRIGRDGSEAHCFCLSDSLNEKSYERISFFKTHTNGFEIAEYDLKQRGSGSLVGTNQHGVDNGLFSRFTEQSYATAKEILDWLKKDQSLFVKVLEIGKQTYDNDIYGKIVFN